MRHVHHISVSSLQSFWLASRKNAVKMNRIVEDAVAYGPLCEFEQKMDKTGKNWVFLFTSWTMSDLWYLLNKLCHDRLYVLLKLKIPHNFQVSLNVPSVKSSKGFSMNGASRMRYRKAHGWTPAYTNFAWLFHFSIYSVIISVCVHRINSIRANTRTRTHIFPVGRESKC